MEEDLKFSMEQDDQRRVFEVINYFDFVYSQKIEYKEKVMTNEFLSLFAFAVNKVIDTAVTYKNEVLIKAYKETEKTFVSSGNESKELYDCCKKIKKHLFGNRIDFRYLLLAEIEYGCTILGLQFADEILTNILLINDKKLLKMRSDISNIALNRDKKLKSSFEVFEKQKQWIRNYNNFQVFNIVVCANLSAGKSTFVNALLGNDVLPARNEATTARITSVYDNDVLKKIIGCVSNGEKITEISNDVNKSFVDRWNTDSGVKHIYLQGDLDGIKCSEIVAAVHDTPGTNNSQDKKHNEITMTFLSEVDLDAVIYVANFEELLTTDEHILLSELYSKVIAIKNIPVIFVINKIDSCDKEKESYDEIVAKYVNHIQKIGFTNYHILPVASKAGRLFKMALQGKSEYFSRLERLMFNILYKTFDEEINVNELSKYPVRQEDIAIYGIQNMKKLEINGSEYSIDDLRRVLVNTGLLGIEQLIQQMISEKK